MVRPVPEEGERPDHGRWTESLHARLRAVAARHLRRDRDDALLQPTAIVHETYLQLRGGRCGPWHSRTHFCAVAARQLRQVLIQHARRRKASKRGGGWRRISLREGLLQTDGPELDLIELDEVLGRLERENRPWARVVELRFFGGLSEREVAAELGVTERTVRRRWEAARAWLKRELSSGGAT